MVGKSVEVFVRRMVGFKVGAGGGATGPDGGWGVDERRRKGTRREREEVSDGLRVLRCMLSGRRTLLE